MEKEELLTYHDRNSASLDCEAAVAGEPILCLPSEKKTQRQWLLKAWKSVGIPLATLIIGFTIGILRPTVSPHVGYRHFTTSYSPAKPHIFLKPESDQKPRTLESDSLFLYSDPISREQESAWTHMLASATTPLTWEEMELAKENPSIKVQYADRENYLSTMGVFHELHCLRMIRRFVHQDFWYANSTAKEIVFQKEHADHCLHAIHKSVMCYADTGLITYQYKKGVSKPLTVTNAQRMCIDWEKFHGWAVSVGTGPGPTLWRPSEA